MSEVGYMAHRQKMLHTPILSDFLGLQWTESCMYSISVSLRPSAHRLTRISIPQNLLIKILPSPILSKLPNPVKNSAFWRSMTTLKLSPQTCLRYFAWIVSVIGLQAKCLLFGWSRHGWKNCCCNISCTKSATTTCKRKEKYLKIKILLKDLWVLFLLGHFVVA